MDGIAFTKVDFKCFKKLPKVLEVFSGVLWNSKKVTPERSSLQFPHHTCQPKAAVD